MTKLLRNNLHILLSVLLALIPAEYSIADIRYRNISMQEGLRSNAVRSIAQDSNGFVWLGTDNGLCRYDGTRVQHYYNQYIGADQFVSALSVGQQGLLVGTAKGAFRFDTHTHVFRLFNRNLSAHITSFAFDGDGNVWLSTLKKGVFRCSKDGKILSHYLFPGTQGNIAMVMCDHNNQLWAVSNSGTNCIYRLDKAADRFRAIPCRSNRYSLNALALCQTVKGDIYIGSWDDGLLRLGPDGSVHQLLDPAATGAGKHIHTLTEYGGNDIYIGADDGLICYNTATHEWHRMTLDSKYEGSSLCDKFVYSIMRDHEGGTWFGTFYSGVNYLSPVTERFVSYTNGSDDASRLGNVVSRFCEDHAGNVWIGSDDGGLSCYSMATKRLKDYAGSSVLKRYNVHALCFDGKNLWIGTYTNGVVKYDVRTGSMRRYTTADGLTGNSSYEIYMDSRHRLWAATMEGVHLLDVRSDRFRLLKRMDAVIIDIEEDKKGNIWLATQGDGLWRCDARGTAWKHFVQTEAELAMPSNQVNCIEMDRDGTMWLATSSGLCRYEGNGKFKLYHLNAPSNEINSIVEDQGVLWLATTRGIIKHTKGDGIQMFNRFDGMASELFQPNAGLKTSDGRIFFGSVKGMTAFYLYKISINTIKGTDQYAQISQDGKQIVQYSFRNGQQTAVLFDVNNTQGEKIESFDGYLMSPDGGHMLIQTHTNRIYRRSFTADFYIYTVASRKLEKLSENGPQQAPVWSPDGNQVAFVRGGNIFLVKLLYDNSESQVTKDGKFNEVINGIPDWVNEEEFSFSHAMAFNADGTMLCWIRYDEKDVKQYSLQMFQGAQPALTENTYYPSLYSYKYPKAGQDNSKVTAWSYDIKAHRTQQLQVPLAADGYMPRILSTDDPARIMVYTMNRHQDELNLYSVNPRSTVAKLLIKESVPRYVKEESMEQIRVGAGYILLPSDRDGYMHLYLYDQNGQLQRKIGDGDYDITTVYGYDEKTGDVYYQAAALAPQDRQIYVTHRNGKTERLTDQQGWNAAVFSSDYRYFVNTWSDRNTPYVYTTRNNDGKVIATNLDNQQLVAKTGQYGWAKKELFSFTTSEGVKLNGWMLRPADFDKTKKYPVIMTQYSGPGSQQVVDSWSIGSMGSGAAYDQYLAQQGFIVVCVDGRGTGARGAEWEKCTYQRLGQMEARDQVETALWLGELPYVDKDRIGIWGWSYGGFCTLMSMSEGRGVFRAGVAVAPPTDWRFYDSIYTERYMRTPKENPEGYGDNPIRRAGKLSGALLICHGVADDNVHSQNTFEYAEALVQADKDFKENYYTNRNHSIYGGNTRNHLLRQIAEWFRLNLK